MGAIINASCVSVCTAMAALPLLPVAVAVSVVVLSIMTGMVAWPRPTSSEPEQPAVAMVSCVLAATHVLPFMFVHL
jgi:hypothetical protein